MVTRLVRGIPIQLIVALQMLAITLLAVYAWWESRNVLFGAVIFIFGMGVSFVASGETEQFEQWRPRTIVGRSLKAYGEFCVSMHRGRGSRVLSRVFIVGAILLLVAVPATIVVMST